MDEAWGKLSGNYNNLENQYPETRGKSPVCMERKVLYDDLCQLYVDIKFKAVNIVADLRAQAESGLVSAPQRVSNARTKRIRMVTVIEKKIDDPAR